jgi:ribonuclease HII
MRVSNLVVGIDEVGRGSLAGPVVAGAVILRNNILGLTDSKKLSKIQREELDKIIRGESIAYGIGQTDIYELNSYGLTYSVAKAMERALSHIKSSYNKIIIDGNYNFLPDLKNVELVIKADETEPVVSAASIIAKVHRDKLMTKLSDKYPNYGFDSNVGYGTKLHLDMIKKFGPCDIHRMFYKTFKTIS